MSISTTPPPAAPPKKKGMGCLGCGCLILVLLVILFFALVGGGSYMAYQKMLGFTSMTPADVPKFTGTDDVYNTAEQKVTEFGQDLKNHQPATLHLNADEINALLDKNPDLARQNAHFFVTLTNDQAKVQGSMRTDAFAFGAMKNRYFNFNTTFGVHFNAAAKNIDIDLHDLQLSDTVIPANLIPTMQTEMTVFLNLTLQKDAAGNNLLQQAKSIAIENGELVVTTQ
jgi:hypothetical protein